MLSFADVLEMARFTLMNPREGALRAMQMNLAMQARWLLLVLVASLSALLTHLSFGLLPPDLRAMMGESMQSPLRSAILQGGVLLAGVLAIHLIGRARGGTGNFADALLLVGWLQFILLGVQIAQLVAQVVAPVVGEVIGIAGIVLFLWVLTNFVAALHGFKSLGSVFLGIIGTIFAVSLAFAMLIVGAGGGNV